MRSIWKRVAALGLCCALTLGTVPTVGAEGTPGATVADWKFGRSYTEGAIGDGTLVVKDQSGNNNNLALQFYNGKKVTDVAPDAAVLEKNLSFSDETMNGTDDGSLIFNGDTDSGIGADFVTADTAPINTATFEDGYTIEFLYRFPEDWTVADSWMGLMARQTASPSNVTSMDEPEMGSMSVAVSNCKEVQFLTAPADDAHGMDSAWSVSMDEGGVWYHIAVTSDNHTIRTFVNGCEAFRDYVSDDMVGLFADPQDGRFRIGSSWYVENKAPWGDKELDKFLQGNLQQVRVSNGALEREDWLIPNPEDFLGEYGSNEAYTLKNPDNYNIVLLPDTQNTVEFRGDVMEQAIDGLIDTADTLNVAGVIHLGDVVDNVDDTQYKTAQKVFYKLPEAGIRTLMQLGNHDGWAPGIANYWNSFSANSTAFMNRTASYLTNNSPSGNSSYMFLRAGSYDYLVISLSSKGGTTAWDSADEAWLKGVLEQYPNCPTIVTSHDIQNCSDTAPSAVKLSSLGKKLWDIVKGYNQVFLLAGGHSHGAGVETLTNDAGNAVFSILTDYQFAYNGGNGFFRYLEFDERADKLYYSTYSPYAASLKESEKGFFDVNFMTGAGNEGALALPFSTRFAGMERAEPETATQGKWMTGEYHTHTGQSKDSTASFMSLANILGTAFRNEEVLDANQGSDTWTDNIVAGAGFDYLMLADHLRNSYNGADGKGNGKYTTPFYVAMQTQQKEIEKLLIQGEYGNKAIYSGFEWDMPGLDHAAVALMDESGNVPYEGVHAFEWLYGSISDGDITSLFIDNGAAEQAQWGPRKGKGNGTTTADTGTAVEAVEWLAENYPDSFVLPNHPSRHAGELTIDLLRKLNDVTNEDGESLVFGFEGMPGNQMDIACELPASAIRAGADEMISVTGGVWDALLSEGRRFYNFANSDFHFKISAGGAYSSGYWASEFSRNNTWVEPGEDGIFTFADVVDGMRSGNSYSVNGELISDLDFRVASGSDSATMGGELGVALGEDITVTIRFKVPEKNNYESLYGTATGIQVSNQPSLDHVDLISGTVTGKVSEANYASTANTDAAIVKTFSKEELAAALGADGYYTLTYRTTAGADRYFRLRGTSTGEVDGNGDPITHEREVTATKPARFDYVNDYNYSHLSFYSNPVFVSAEARTDGFVSDSALPMELVGRYTSGGFSVDGGVMEIVAYNSANKHAYAVNGQSGKLALIPMKELGKTEGVTALTAAEFDVAAAVAAMDSTFAYGDMTSVAVSPDGSTLAAALQAEGYADPGRVAIFTCKTDGSLTLKKVVKTGVQPDMVVFADGSTLLTADEGEPREGYQSPAVDPKGTVSVIDVATGASVQVDFTRFDDSTARQALVEGGIVLKKNTAPSVDLEPEYIAVSGGKAYVSLQEANAIAVLDLAGKSFTGIYSVGFEDYGAVAVDIDKSDAAYSPKTYPGLLGIRMPDGIDVFTTGGKTYLVTANEGDSRDWNDYSNEKEVGKKKPSPAGNVAENAVGGKVVYFDTADYDGLDSAKDYLFGGRTFTVLEVTDSGLRQVFTSGSDFEAKTAQYLPAYFNISNDNTEMDNRSGKKGPEPESVTVGTVGGRTYAFVALERTGGIMAYDVTDPANAAFVNYINTRDFQTVVPGSVDGSKFVTGGDVAPEGLKFLPAAQSPTGYPLLLAACEVSGTVAVYQAGTEFVDPNPPADIPSGSGSTATETVKNPDGSTTTTVTNKKTGAVTITTTYKDGAKVVTSIPKDGEALSTVTVPQGKTAKVTIPAKSVTPGTVAVILHADGTEEIVKTSVAAQGGVTFLASASVTVKLVDNTKHFADVADDNWAAAAIQFAASRELFNGTGSDCFTPGGDMSRAMLLTVLARLDGQDTAKGDTWWAVGAAWAKERGISDGTGLEQAVSREQLAVMLYRYAKAEKTAPALSGFSDADKVSSWAAEAMGWAVQNGIINGKSGALDSQGTATRAEVAAMLERFVNAPEKR